MVRGSVFFAFLAGLAAVLICISFVATGQEIEAEAENAVKTEEVQESISEEPPSTVVEEVEAENTVNPEETQESISEEPSSTVVGEVEDDSPVLEHDKYSERSTNFAPDIVSLEQIQALIQSGAIKLANGLLVDWRPSYSSKPNWVEWELLFYETSVQLQNWQHIIDRVEETSYKFSRDDGIQIQPYAVTAEIHLGNTASARKRLRTLIWNSADSRESVLNWRNLIINSYLADEAYEEAYIALTRFDKDYRPSSPDWEHTFARVLLRIGKFGEAVKRVEALQTGEGKLLERLARLNSGASTPGEIMSLGQELEAELEGRPDLKQELWAMIELAARIAGDVEMQVVAIENELLIASSQDFNKIPVVELNTERQLLNAYANYAESVGNSFNLIVGEDEPWIELAREYEVLSPVTARALYAFLAVRGLNEQLRRTSIASLSSELARAGYDRILDLLFLENRHFAVALASPDAQLRMANRAVLMQDYVNASLISNAIAEVPNELEEIDWALRKARLAILANNNESSVEIMFDLVRSLPPGTEMKSIDKIVQVIFDLQEREQFEAVVELMTILYGLSSDVNFKREVLYWIAEAYSSMENPVLSADMFLRSAKLVGDFNDDWGQSARFRAAEELAKASLIDDAQNLLQKLLNITLDPRRRALIESNMEDLRQLREAAIESES